VAVFKLFVLPLLITLLSTTTQDIEKAFLQNNPKTLYSLFSAESGINISRQQAYFLFKKIFSSYTTFEFFSESEIPPDIEDESFIFRARWSFRDNKNNNQHVLHIFLFLLNETGLDDRASPSLSGREGRNPKNAWKIIEIKAEKI